MTSGTKTLLWIAGGLAAIYLLSKYWPLRAAPAVAVKKDDQHEFAGDMPSATPPTFGASKVKRDKFNQRFQDLKSKGYTE